MVVESHFCFLLQAVSRIAWVVVIDNSVTYCGSQNCAGREFWVKATYAPWVDLLVHCKGPIVRQYHYLFAGDWQFGTGEPIQEPLCTSSRRSVDTTIIVSADTDSSIVGVASRSCYSDLLDAGVQICKHMGACSRQNR